ncbi:hypothetical protein [Streptomyces boninensis]|uniref:hypothetical protein n=1 Tax=Streptomyces boninensis TaxID=2039455 RepID=UPI003B222FB9
MNDHGAPDPHRCRELRTGGYAAAALLAALIVSDLATGALALPRAAGWAGLALVVYVLVRPPRIEAQGGLLTVRGLLREQRVRTDQLITIRARSGMGSRLVLEDLMGGRVTLDPRQLAASPLLWHHLDTGVRRSRERGFLRGGTRELQALADHIDGGGARKVFEASGLT